MEGGASSTSDDWKVVDDEKPEVKELEKARSLSIVLKWAKLLKKYWGIRKLQCVFHGTGKYLGEQVSKECRERLSKVYREKK